MTYRTVSERIESGALPATLEGADWLRYQGRDLHPATWQGFCSAIDGIMWVRCQAFDRDGEGEAAADDWREP